jgi:uncharacterized membrane protein YeaQ/YmgE (transglycosylase-associated protein family)
MDHTEVGWITAIITGGIAGWLCAKFMQTRTWTFIIVILGILGAGSATFVFGLIGISLGGWVWYVVAGFIGACLLIASVRLVTLFCLTRLNP